MSTDLQETNSNDKGYNDLIIKWLNEWCDNARRTNSKVGYNYLKALKAIREHDKPIQSAAECKPLRGFGDKTCAMLEKKLRQHLGPTYNPAIALDVAVLKPANKRNGGTQASVAGSDLVQSTITNIFSIRKRLVGGKSVSRNPSSPSIQSPAPKIASKIRKRSYIPQQGSSGFAILVTLLRYEYEYNQKLVNKLDLQNMAQRYCNSSMGQTNQSISFVGWQTMKTLLNKGLVAKTDIRNSFYFLTDDGRKLAKNLAFVSPVLREFTEKYFEGGMEDNDDDCEVNSDDEVENEEPVDPIHRPFIFEPGSYEIILCIDNRERIQTNIGADNRAAFAAALQKQDVKVEIRQLPLGDFLWIAREKSKSVVVGEEEEGGGAIGEDATSINSIERLLRFASISTEINTDANSASTAISGNIVRKELVLDFIIERKRIDDLAASIKDSRWHEQKYRLLTCGIRRPIYLIEYMGKQSHKIDYAGMSASTLEQAAINCEIDGFDVKRTDNFEETVRYLTFMTRCIEQRLSDRALMSAPSKVLAKTIASDYRYIAFNEFLVNAGKVQTFTAKEMFVKHLLQIKGLSIAKIHSIVDRYPTFCRLLVAYDRQRDLYSRHNLLTDLQTGAAVGNNRRLGPMISRKVFDYYNVNDKASA